MYYIIVQIKMIYNSSENFHSVFLQGENPIYKQATSTFKNPMYSGR